MSEGTEAAIRLSASMRIRALVLEVLDGPDAGLVVRVDRPLFVIGTGEGSDLRLRDTTVSREHVRLSLREGGVLLRDDASKNGTFVFGLRVHEIVITEALELLVGNTKLRLKIDAAHVELPVSKHKHFGEAIGESESMRHVFSLLERAAASDVTLLLEGESGVGKEVLARGVHAQSPRAAGPFVTVDCGAIPHELIEAELFGHQKGAFTGATEARAGLFEQADGGTLFLDEIGELPLDLQPKLLRVLERREVRRVGGRELKVISTRVVAATNRRLSESVRRGEFRQDLFYRLAALRVVVPPLRERPEDILPLARLMLRAALAEPDAEVPPDLAAMLAGFRWPGNVRELRNVIERYALLGMRDSGALFDEGGPGAPLDVEDDVDLSVYPYAEARRRALARFERTYAARMLERTGGVVVKAAELAGIKRPSFYRLMGRSGKEG